MTNKLLAYNTIRNTFWFQRDSNEFQVGQILSSYVLDALIKEAKSSGAVVLDTTSIDEKTAQRLVKKFFNRLGYVNDVEMYQEALMMNGAVEV